MSPPAGAEEAGYVTEIARSCTKPCVNVGMSRFVANNQDNVPGRLHRRYASESCDAGPVNFIDWFGAPHAYSLSVILHLHP